MATDDKIAQLYTWAETMTAAGDEVKTKHEDEYKTMIDYARTASTKERILSAQLIARFFKHFPAHEDNAFNAIVDLCESQDVDVRKHAALAMMSICRDCKNFVSRAADILIQLYQTNQPSEVQLINQILTTLLGLNIKEFLKSFFANFDDGNETVRGRALKFLASKIPTLSETVLSRQVEELLMSYSKKAMEDVTKDEFLAFISILSKLKIAKMATGQAMIVLVIKSQAELDKEFNVNDSDALDKFLLCTKHTIPLLSQYNRASEYINYICNKVLPHLKTLSSNGNDLRILQALAEMSPFIHNDDIPDAIDLEACQKAVYDKLLEYLPMPPQADPSAEPATVEETPADAQTEAAAPKEEQAAEASGEDSKTAAPAQSKSETDFQFTHIEYLIYTLHQLGRIKNDFFTETLMGDIKLRLQHLALGCSKYMEILSAQLRAVKKSEDLKTEENKLRSVALRTTKNITTIIRDLMRKPPQFTTSVLLSCKPLTAPMPGDTLKKSPANVNTNANNSSNNNNNGSNRPPRGSQDGNKGGNPNRFSRQAGQKHKYRQHYNNGNKRQRAR